MKSDERELLTIEKFVADAQSAKKPAIAVTAILEAVSLLLFIIILAAVISSPSVAGIIMAAIIGVLTAAGAYILTAAALPFKPGNIVIVEDEVEFKADEAEDTKNALAAFRFLVSGRYDRRRIVQKSVNRLIRFKNYGDYEFPAEPDDVVFQLASPGDKFYLAVTKSADPKIVGIYDQRRYRV